MAGFTPAGLAASIRNGLRPGADPEERRAIRDLWEYRKDYLAATAHRDGNRPCSLPDGTTVYYAKQAAAEALFYLEVYGMALGLNDDDPHECLMAKTAWKSADWRLIWAEIQREERALGPVT
jgi:hypothetical protein